MASASPVIQPNTVQGGLLAGLQVPPGSIMPAGALTPGGGAAPVIAGTIPNSLAGLAPQAPVQKQYTGADQATQDAFTTIANINLPALAANPVTLEGTYMRPDLAAYDARYTNAFNQSRSGIANQLSRAMQDIQTQEDLANQAISKLDPRYAEVFGAAQTNAQNFANQQAAAAQGMGLSGAIGLDPNMIAALQGAEGAFKSTTGMVGIGSQQMHGQARGRLEQANLGALADIQGKEADWIGRRAELETKINQDEAAFKNEQNKLRMEQERQRQEMETRKAELAQQRNLAQAEIRSRESIARQDRAEARAARGGNAAAEKRAQESHDLQMAAGKKELAADPPEKVAARAVLDQTHGGHSADRGRALATFGYGQHVRGLESYKNLSDYVAKKGGQEWFRKDPDKAQSEIFKFAKPHWDPDTLSIFLAEMEAGKVPQKKKRN